MIADKIIAAYEKTYASSLITDLRINGDSVNIPIPTLLESLEHLFYRRQAEKEQIEGFFFGQPVKNVIYKFFDGSCIIFGLATAPCPFKSARTLDEAKKLNETIYD